MASFSEPFDSLGDWDFGTSPTTKLTLASTSPTPYIGPSRAQYIQDDVIWGAARFDLDDGNVPATTYWVSFAFYIDSWAAIFNGAGYINLPGFINAIDDPMKGFDGTDNVLWLNPFLLADSTSAGKIYPFSGAGAGTSVTEDAWHTCRAALKLNGASSFQEIWLDNVQVYSAAVNYSFLLGGGVTGVGGVLLNAYGDSGAADNILAIDSMLYEAGADPGEPAEPAGPTATEDSDPTDVVEDAVFPPSPSSPSSDSGLVVTLNGVDFTGCALSGAVTRRLNRPAQATIKIPMDCASGCGGPGARLKISFDGGDSLFFHGMVQDWELDGGEDMGYITMNAMDPMELWSFRPARDGPDSNDPGDFSNPRMFTGLDYTPNPGNILENLLTQSIDGSDQALGEGTLFLDFGTFEAGGASMAGAPVDWPMTIAEVVNLMVSTGELDVVITPTDPGGGIMGTVDSYNGDYGTDLSGSVVFEYGAGARNVRNVRWNQDMSNVCNKLWYYGGPRIATAADPGALQHWCFNVQGDDLCFTGGLCPSPDAARFVTAFTAVDGCRGEGEGSPGDSRGDYGVRMDVQIFDAASENCVGPDDVFPERDLYRWLWLAESWARCTPRTLIHITPTRGTAIGSFDIGDLVGVNIAGGICGGASGAQRIYQYTISWDPDGPFELSELQTSSDVGLTA